MSLSHRGQSFIRKAIGFRRQLELSPPLVISGSCKFVIRVRHARFSPSAWLQLTKTSLRLVTKYRKYISGVRVVLWVKGTEYIWVGQLITHRGDMHIIWPYAVTCHKMNISRILECESYTWRDLILVNSFSLWSWFVLPNVTHKLN